MLASASPRRLDLLRQIGIEPDAVVATGIDETPRPQELPRHHVRRLAREKAEAARADLAGAADWILSADTVVAVGRRILPKAEDEDTARRCLEILSGRAHRVTTALCLIVTPSNRVRERAVESRVRFKRLGAAEIDAYIQSGEWRGKAGGYAIQGRAGAFAAGLVGSFSGVVGLPLYETATLLEGEGYPVRRCWGEGG